jgi:regulator of sigma E protease
MDAVFNVAQMVFWVLLAIMILVFVHELGHYLAAKFFGMRVTRFSVGFPPKVVGKQIGETEYVLGATPLGGYVKIEGMVDESMDTDFVGKEPEPWEFRAKPVWQRIIVIVAGVVFNIILAAVIFAGLRMTYGDVYVPAENIESIYVAEGSLAYDMGLRTGDRLIAVAGEPLERYEDFSSIENLMADEYTVTVLREGREQTFIGPDDLMTQLTRAEGDLGVSALPALVGGVVTETAAEEAGLQPGDRITAIAGEPVRFWTELTTRLQATEGQAVSIRFERPDSLGTIADASGLAAVGAGEGTTVYESTVAPRFDEGTERYMLGVAPPTQPMILAEYGIERREFGFFEALGAGVTETWTRTGAIATSLQRVFTGRDNFRENVGGPIMIAQVTKEAAEMGARYFWNIVAMLSITLAIMNILPIPALDGGHLIFLIYEGITRREPSIKVRMALQQIGMIILLVFMVFLIFNDILR